MAVTVNINGLSCLHQTSGGSATATLPDVCKTPPNSVPVPYPNIAMSTDLVGGTVTVAVDGSSAAIQSSMFVRSTGDEPGALGGVVSQVFAMEATFLSFSPTVLMEGQPACRLTDKMLMNKGNTVCMLGAINPVVVDQSLMPPNALGLHDPEEPVFCHIDSFQLMCKHDEHQHINGMEKNHPVLQVISTSDKPDVVTVSATGSCGDGNPDCPAVWVFQYPSGEQKQVSINEGKFELPPPVQLEELSLKSVGQFIERLMGDLPTTRDVYIFHPMICNKHPSPDVSVGAWAQVEVFHKASVSGELTLGYGHPTMPVLGPLKEHVDHPPNLVYDRQATWTIGGKIEASLGGRSFKVLEKSSDMKGSDPLPLFGTLVDAIGATTYIFDSMTKLSTKVEGKILYPNWKINVGTLELAELKKSSRVGLMGTFYTGFDPLIGFQLKVSILDWLIILAGSLAPGVGTTLAKALLYIKDKFKPDPWDPKKKAVSLDLDIELTATSSLEGGMGIKYMEGEGSLDGDKTNITGKVNVQLEGRLIANAKVWRIEFSGGGKMGLGAAEGDGSKPCGFEAAVTATIERGRLIPDGSVSFSGMAFYYLLYIEVGAGGAESEKKAEANTDEPARRLSTSAPAEKKEEKKEEKSEPTKLAKEELKGSCVLIKPWSWSYRKGWS